MLKLYGAVIVLLASLTQPILGQAPDDASVPAPGQENSERKPAGPPRVELVSKGDSLQYIVFGLKTHKGSAYLPGCYCVMRWVNKDKEIHTATSDDNGKDGKPLFDTGDIEPDKAFAIKFDAALFEAAGCTKEGQTMILKYHDTHNKGLKGTVVLHVPVKS